MNRTDRLYALVEELRAVAPRPRSARQLAGRYEVSTRTIERDILALQESGVPIYAEPGRTGGYVIDKTQTLPPLNFTASEMVALAVSLAGADETPFSAALRSALRKVLASAPAAQTAAAAQLMDRVRLVSPVGARRAGPPPAAAPHPSPGAVQTVPGAVQTVPDPVPTVPDPVPTEPGTVPTENGMARTENGTVPPNNGTVRTKTGMARTENGTVPPNNGTVPPKTDTARTKTGTVPPKTDTARTATGVVRRPAGAVAGSERGPARSEHIGARAAVPLAIQEAITSRHVLALDYRDRNDAVTVREVEPVAFVGIRSLWYLLAWCRLRDGARAFRLDRIVAVTDTGEPAPHRSYRDLQVDIPEDIIRRPELTG